MPRQMTISQVVISPMTVWQLPGIIVEVRMVIGHGVWWTVRLLPAQCAISVTFPSVQVSEKGHRYRGKHKAAYMQGGGMTVMTIKTQNGGRHLPKYGKRGIHRTHTVYHVVRVFTSLRVVSNWGTTVVQTFHVNISR